MRSVRRALWAMIAVVPLLCTAILAEEIDDTVPDVTARVARISLIRGEVKVRRAGSQDWEKAVLNLPLVEGDEIATEAGARVELQFDTYTHVRLDERSAVTITTLADEGIALSIAEGTISARLTEFNKDRSYFEIDAPNTTLAPQRSGLYRVEAGRAGAGQVRLAATDLGEARVYSDTSGFTLKNGRSATIRIDGALAGEWDIADASRFADEFDSWVLERDEVIAKRLRDAHYNKYYDRDIYGAEELSDHGEWIHTKKYGYVWRPYRAATARYANWSPYRYGHWRWVPPYGWTWVNDEPWGWATYHHGRWVFDGGYWYWTPYGYYRHSRSWWFPALVGITIINRNVCWYPLPYNYGYYNYNYYYGGYNGRGRRGRGNNHYGGGGGGNNNNNSNNGPTPTPTPTNAAPQIGPNAYTSRDQRFAWMQTPPLQRVPPSGVVTTPISSFGSDTGGHTRYVESDAKAALTKALGDQRDPIRVLPNLTELDARVSTAIRAEKPRSVSETKVPTGAAIRTAGSPLDRDLQQVRFYGDRKPVAAAPPDATPDRTVPRERKTGAVTRDVSPRGDDSPVRVAPRSVEPQKRREADNEPVREPIFRQPEKPRNSDPVRAAPPRQEAPQKPREDRPQSEPVRPAPRSEPPPTRSSPPPAKSDPPPSKSEPSPSKSEPSKSPPVSERKNKDG